MTPDTRLTRIGVRATPHGHAALDQARRLPRALDALLRAGCLIDYTVVSADAIRVHLHRSPPPGLVAAPTAADGQCRVAWRGVTLSWTDELAASA